MPAWLPVAGGGGVQLTLLEPDRLTADLTADLRKRVPDGPAKLLAVLVKRGLTEEAYHEAARLLLAWDAHAATEAKAARAEMDAPEAVGIRSCRCGCQRSLDGRRANARYFDDACRTKALRARKASTPTRTPRIRMSRAHGLPRTLREAA